MATKQSGRDDRVTVDAAGLRRRACIRDTRIEVAVILDGLAEGLTLDGLIDHYPQLIKDDIRAALAYAAELAHEGLWKMAANA